MSSKSRIQMPRRQKRAGRIRDLLLYTAIGALIVAALSTFAVHQARTGGSPNLPLKWLGFAGMTAIVFGNTIRGSRPLWGRQRFWLLVGLFFAMHSGLGMFVLMRVPTVPLVLYGVLPGVEYVILAAYLDFFLRA